MTSDCHAWWRSSIMQSFELFQISYVNVLRVNVTLGWDKISAINFYSQQRDKQIYFPPLRELVVEGVRRGESILEQGTS